MDIVRNVDNGIGTEYTNHGQRVLLSPIEILSRGNVLFHFEDIDSTIESFNKCGVIYGEGKTPLADTAVTGAAPTLLSETERQSLLGELSLGAACALARSTLVDVENVTHALRNFKCETLTLNGETFQAITADFKATSPQMREYLEEKGHVSFSMRATAELLQADSTGGRGYNVTNVITWDLHPT